MLFYFLAQDVKQFLHSIEKFNIYAVSFLCPLFLFSLYKTYNLQGSSHHLKAVVFLL